MNKKTIIRKQQFTFMLANLIAFTIIFAIFGVIIFGLVQNTLYSKVDEELLSFKELPSEPITDKKGFHRDPERKAPNPRIIVLHWNDKGEIVNEDQIGTIIFENYLYNLVLNKEALNTIENMNLDDQYHFRTMTYAYEGTEDYAYTQLLISVDAEQSLLEHFGEILFICIVVCIILSISASYLLSKKTMKPIIQSWNKQAEFVENASHELRTPLTIIQNKLELLLTTPNKKIVNVFESIALSLSETRRLSKLTTDLLTLARADSLETQLVKDRFNLDEFVQQVCLPYVEIAELAEKHLWLQLKMKEDIYADQNRLHQLFVILLDNALKYTGEKDSIGVKTYIEENKAVIEVSDTGIGISDEGKKHIFERFFREDKARSRENGGTGLGLSIARWIVRSHNGSIKVYNNHPKGTIIKVKFPKI